MIIKLFKLDAADTIESIKNALSGIDESILKMVDILSQDPTTTNIWTIVENAVRVSTSIALVLCVLYWLISFIREITDKDWRSLSIWWYFRQIIKLILAKALIDIAPDLLITIYKFIAWAMREYAISNTTDAIFSNLDWSVLENSLEEASFMKHLFIRIEIQLPNFIIWISSGICQVIAYGRILQICLLTIISPISMSTYSNGQHSGVFPTLREYVAVVGQAVVMILASQLYKGLIYMIIDTNISNIKSIWMLAVSSVVFVTTVLGSQKIAKLFLGR